MVRSGDAVFLLSLHCFRTNHHERQLQWLQTQNLPVFISWRVSLNCDKYLIYFSSSYSDATIVSFMDTFTSLLAGVTIFSILGNLAHESGKPIETVVQGGTGLV